MHTKAVIVNIVKLLNVTNNLKLYSKRFIHASVIGNLNKVLLIVFKNVLMNDYSKNQEYQYRTNMLILDLVNICFPRKSIAHPL